MLQSNPLKTIGRAIQFILIVTALLAGTSQGSFAQTH